MSALAPRLHEPMTFAYRVPEVGGGLVVYHDGVRTGLIGAPEQIATRIREHKRTGVDLMLLGFLHFHEEVEHVGREVLPIVRELEAAETALVGA